MEPEIKKAKTQNDKDEKHDKDKKDKQEISRLRDSVIEIATREARVGVLNLGRTENKYEQYDDIYQRLLKYKKIDQYYTNTIDLITEIITCINLFLKWRIKQCNWSLHQNPDLVFSMTIDGISPTFEYLKGEMLPGISQLKLQIIRRDKSSSYGDDGYNCYTVGDYQIWRTTCAYHVFTLPNVFSVNVNFFTGKKWGAILFHTMILIRSLLGHNFEIQMYHKATIKMCNIYQYFSKDRMKYDDEKDLEEIVTFERENGEDNFQRMAVFAYVNLIGIITGKMEKNSFESSIDQNRELCHSFMYEILKIN